MRIGEGITSRQSEFIQGLCEELGHELDIDIEDLSLVEAHRLIQELVSMKEDMTGGSGND